MQHTSRALTAAYVGVAAADTWLSGMSTPRSHRLRRLTKPALMPLLTASLLTSAPERPSPLRRTTLLAQAFGWGGDVALLRDGEAAFFAGAGSFAVGHGAYITGFHRLRRTRRALREERGVMLVAGIWAASTPAVALAAARKDPKLAIAVVAYSATLTTTLVSAIRLGPAVRADSRRLAMAGAALFLLSDAILGARMFLIEDPPPGMERLVMATYTAAQLLLSEAARHAPSIEAMK
ncbi:lysoplasmalogenase [Nocardioides sp.]|uniref:lysoplasmalogenase n=1 Tax=Nocardioides sp. TaxID=35761 RepID=UPI003D14A8EC